MNSFTVNRATSIHSRQGGDSSSYATVDDFCALFTAHMGPLYWLSFLLTGDRDKAEQCFLSGLEDCVQGNRVFKEWAHVRAKRAIVQNAIRILQPRPSPADSALREGACHQSWDVMNTGNLRLLTGTVLAVHEFDRMVFVMCVLERYSDFECSRLLCCSRREIREARARALTQIADAACTKSLGQVCGPRGGVVAAECKSSVCVGESH